MPALSDMDISMIRNNMKSKSARQLASMLDLPVYDIEKALIILGAETGVVTRQQEMDKKKAANIKSKPVKNKVISKIISQRKANSEAADYHTDRRKNFDVKSRSKFPTRIIDYSEMQTVKINAGTTIFINMGDDPVKAKAEFLQRAETKRKLTYSIK